MKTAFITSTLATIALGTFATSAHAGTTTVTDPNGGTTTITTPSDGNSNSSGSSEEGGSAAKWGISTAFPTGGDIANLDFLYGLGGANWLDVTLGFNIDHTPANAAGAPANTLVEANVGLGYRMYKAASGRIHPYMEPAIDLSIGDFGNAGKTVGLGIAGKLGVDFQLFSQFTLGVQLAASLDFISAGDTFNQIHVGTSTSNINATFWW